MTGVTAVSGASTPGKNTTKAGVVIETMSAPNPVKCSLYALGHIQLYLFISRQKSDDF